MTRNETLILIAAALIILIIIGFLPLSSILAIFAPNPVTAVGSTIVLTCVDTQECRSAIFPLFEDYTVKPDKQQIIGVICSNTPATVAVHNPLLASDLQVDVNGQVMGELKGGETKNFTFYVIGRRPPSFSLDTIYETSTAGINARYVRGWPFDSDKKMGKTITLEIRRYPTYEQKDAFNTIVQFENEVDSCLSRVKSSGEDETPEFIKGNQSLILDAKSKYMSCDFASAKQLVSADIDGFKTLCAEFQPRNPLESLIRFFDETIKPNLCCITGVIILLLIFYFVILPRLSPNQNYR